MTKNFFKILFIFAIGIAGGVFADKILLNRYKAEQGPVYLTEKKEITTYVQENVVLREAVEKVAKTAIGVRAKVSEGVILRGSGLVVSNDGFLVTLASLIPQGSNFAFYVDAKWPQYQVLKRDLKNNLALVKVENSGLQTAGFAEMEKIKLGERVFLVGFDFSSTTPRLMANEGVIKFFDKDLIKTNIVETSLASGSPLFNIEGNVVGLNVVAEDGKVSAIPASKISQFIGF